MGISYEMEVEETCRPLTRHELLRERIAKYCLPDQADKVILTLLADIQGYDEGDTHRNVNNIIKELAESNLGIA